MTDQERLRKALASAITAEQIGSIYHDADEIAEKLMLPIMAVLTMVAHQAVLAARQEGMRDVPERDAPGHRIEFLRRGLQMGADAPAGAMLHPLECQELLDVMAHQSAVIDHQAARIAALAHDEGQWQDGYRAGWQDAKKEDAQRLP